LILIEHDSFSYAVTYQKRLLAYEANYALSELTTPQKLYELLTSTFKKVVVGLPANGFSLVPSALFSADHVADFSRLLDVRKNESVLAQVLDEKNHVVYKISEQVQASALRFDLKNAVFAATGWAKAIAQNSPLNNYLYLNIGSEKIEFLYFKHHNIRFYNSFEFKTPDDVVYYAVLVAEELDMQPKYVSLVISGNINPGDKIHAHLAEFFPDLVMNKINLLELPEKIAPHQILSLAALSLCESLEVF